MNVIEDTVEPCFTYPGIISLFITCIGITTRGYFVVRGDSSRGKT